MISLSPRRPSSLRLVPALAVAALLAALVPAGAEASRGQKTVIQDDHLLFDPATRQSTISEFAALGVDVVRVNVIWRDFAPAPNARSRPSFDERDPDAYKFTDTLDHIVRGIDAAGMQPMLTVTAPAPLWASAGARSHVYKPSPTRFGRFAQAVGKRYSGRHRGLPRVRYWSIYNEPNQPGWLQPQYSRRKPYSPYLYRRLYRSAERGLRASGHRSSRILIGETAPLGSSRGRSSRTKMQPVTFIRELFCFSRRYRGCRKPPKLRASGFAHHPYVQYRNRSPRWRGKRGHLPVGATKTLVSMLRKARRMRRTTRTLSVYFTEYGRQTNPPDRRTGVSRTKQARYINETEYIAYRNSRVKMYSQYLMNDDRELNLFQTGLKFADGRVKPAYNAFRTPLVANRRRGSSRVTLWGRVRPGSGRRVVTVEYYHKRRWRKLRRKSTNSRGYWTTRTRYRRGRKYRVKWDSGVGTTTGPSVVPVRF